MLLVADQKGWAFDSHCREIKKRLTEFKIDIVYHRDNIPLLARNYNLVYILDPMPLAYPDPLKTILGLRCEFLFREHPAGAKGLYESGFPGHCVSIKDKCCIFHVVNKYQMEVFKNVVLDKPLLLAQHGVDEQIFNRNKYKKPINDILTVGVAGRSSKNKGFSLVKEACDRVGARFVMTDYYSGLPKERMPEFYNSLDVFCCMSLTEGLNNPSMECGAMSVPIISTKSGAATEMIKDGVSGFLIDRNVNALCDALNKMKDKNLRENMGNEFHKEIIKNWTWAVRIEDFRKMFNLYFEGK
jgi:glycosyltransferase involved in cell wall biosynthesis